MQCNHVSSANQNLFQYQINFHVVVTIKVGYNRTSLLTVDVFGCPTQRCRYRTVAAAATSTAKQAQFNFENVMLNKGDRNCH